MNTNLLRFDQEKTLVFFDAETLNLCLNFSHNLPWQVAIIALRENKILAEKEIYIKWDTNLKISKDAARITRYDPNVVEEKGIKPEEAIEIIYPWFEKADWIIGHNIIGFDIYIIKEFYKFMKKPWRQLLNKFLDTNCLAKASKLNIPFNNGSLTAFQFKLYHTKTKGMKTNLTALGKEFGIEFDYENLHRAVNDLKLNIEIYNKLKYMVDF